MKRITTILILTFITVTGLQGAPDQYWKSPQGDYRSRLELFREYCSADGLRTGLAGIYTQSVYTAAGNMAEERCLRDALSIITEGADDSDVTLNGVLRLLYLNKNSVPESIYENLRSAIIGYDYRKYEAGNHGDMAFYTDSRLISNYTAEYLAGELYPGETFRDGTTGSEHAAHALTLIRSWLAERFMYGFPEWNSISYETYIATLLSLHDLSRQSDIKESAKPVLDLLFYDLALVNFDGALPVTSGRGSVNSLITGYHSLSPVMKLVFGTGIYLPDHIAAAAALATSGYECPEIIRHIALERDKTNHSRQKTGIGSDPASSTVYLQVLRAPEFIISSANDYSPGTTGYREVVWQAALDNETVVFTTHPSHYGHDRTPSYWVGNASMPKVAQYGSTLVCMYDAPHNEGLDKTHAYFPRDLFEEVVHYGGWLFGRKGDGYVALRSQNPTQWYSDATGAANDLVAEGRRNIWICETSSRALSGGFMEYILEVNSNPVRYDARGVTYESPLSGTVVFSWDSGLTVNGQKVESEHGYRYDNIYGRTDYGSRSVEITREGEKLVLEYK